jgi:hypothetical protein
MAGLVPAIHVFCRIKRSKTWMPGTRPGMTNECQATDTNCGPPQLSQSKRLVVEAVANPTGVVGKE